MPTPHLNRRRLLKMGALGLAASGAGITGYTFLVGPHHLQVTQRKMRLPRLPDNLVGKRLLHLSDLHVGTRVDSGYLKRALRIANGLKADLICITGDFMSYQDPGQIGEMADVVSTLERPPLGIAAILGNHDYGHNWSQQDVGDEAATRLRQLGLQLLRNEIWEPAPGLQILGFDDLWSGNFDPASPLAQADPQKAHLALTHNPDTADHAAWAGAGFHGWLLAGHTHGGQCKPPFLPPPMLPVRNTRYTKGVFQLDQARTLHINPGLGHLLKVRFNVRPEITVFELASA